MIKLELNLYPEKSYTYIPQQNTQTLYTEEHIKNLHQSAINNNLKINTILQNKVTKSFIMIIAYISSPYLVYTINDEASFIKCQYIDNNGNLGNIINFSYTITELLNDFYILKEKD